MVAKPASQALSDGVDARALLVASEICTGLAFCCLAGARTKAQLHVLFGFGFRFFLRLLRVRRL